VLAATTGQSLVVCADTMVSGVHFFPDALPSHLGYKLAMVNLSDLAAMGANPVWATLCLTLPTADEAWLASFSNGLYEALDAHDVALVGGDTTKGPMTLTLQLGGEVDAGQAITRSGANIGDAVWVSGELGAAAYALGLLVEKNAGSSIDTDQLAVLRKHLERPEARVDLGLALSGIASSCIDVSDGLFADASHICEASEVGIDLQLECLPFHLSLVEHLAAEKVLNCAVTGGDDYELLFTVGPDKQQTLIDVSARLGLSLTKIGTVTNMGVVRCFKDNLDVSTKYTNKSGFNHFT
jgi:thiamine-monophosphate kinase